MESFRELILLKKASVCAIILYAKSVPSLQKVSNKCVLRCGGPGRTGIHPVPFGKDGISVPRSRCDALRSVQVAILTAFALAA